MERGARFACGDSGLDDRPGVCWPTEPGVREGYPSGVVVEIGRGREGDIGGQGPRGVAAAVITCSQIEL